MSELSERRGPSPALFLLIPVAFIAGTKAARHAGMHRAAAYGGWGPGDGPEGAGPEGAPEYGTSGPWGGHGPWGGRGRFGRGFGRGFGWGFGPWAANVDPDTLQLPPMIERVLNAWHTRAHRPAESAGPAGEAAAEA